jgi:hypothetical protein
MTEFTLPPFALDYDTRWVAVDLHGDLGDWARRAARDVLTRFDVRGGGRREKRLANLFEGAGKLARQADDASMAFLLYPILAEGVRALVRFCPVDLSGCEEEEAWSVLAEGLFPPESWADNPPEVTEIASQAGRCRRFLQRYVRSDGTEGPVGEQVAYLWVFPQYGAGVVMTTAFPNLEEAGRWRPTLDELAAAAELDESS